MPKYVRKLERASDWDKSCNQSIDNINADALASAKTKDNKLSIYTYVSESDLKLILCALAIKRESLKDVNYATFDDSVFELSGIKNDDLKWKKGTTQVAEVNAMHINIENLTAQSLALFVSYAVLHGQVNFIGKSEILDIVVENINNNKINLNAVDKNIIAKYPQIGNPTIGIFEKFIIRSKQIFNCLSS